MADYILESRVWLARARPDVFAFFAAAENLVLLTPPSFRLQVVAGPSALSAGAVSISGCPGSACRCAGARSSASGIRPIDSSTCRCAVRTRAGSIATAFSRSGGGTWVEDRVTYRLPLGPLGRVAHALLVRRQIAAMWRYRTRRLGELVGPVSSPPAG